MNGWADDDGELMMDGCGREHDVADQTGKLHVPH